MQRDLDLAAASWLERGWPRPQVLLVTGSGLGVELGATPLAHDELSRLLPFPTERLEGHAHRISVLRIDGSRVLLYQEGRLHLYQGHDPHEVVFSVRLAARLGARVLLMASAAGSLDPRRTAGDLVALHDHLNLTGANPLAGSWAAGLGPRFPDLRDAYSPRLRQLAHRLAAEQGLELHEGIYAGLAGPSYETPAEVRMLRALGADLVGMSTVLEVIAARQLGLECLCLATVTNLAAGLTPEPLLHDDVVRRAGAAAGRVAGLLAALARHPGLVAPEPAAATD